jgi:Kef-type K+ transport system membrane component KefB
MSIGVANGTQMWLYCGLIIVVAILGKLGGSMIAARFSGMRWRESGAIGILMNTRGLVQLVVLNIGLDIGVLSPALFSMMVLMALVTTFMTTPLLALVYPRRIFEREVIALEGNDKAA